LKQTVCSFDISYLPLYSYFALAGPEGPMKA